MSFAYVRGAILGGAVHSQPELSLGFSAVPCHSTGTHYSAYLTIMLSLWGSLPQGSY